MANGITIDTIQRRLIDDAVIYLNYGETTGEKILSATVGGSKFVVQREYKDTEVDGARGVVKGLRRIISEIAFIEANLLENKLDTYQAILPGTEVAQFPSTSSTHDELSSTLKISDSDYIKNIAIVGKISGSNQPFVGIIYNAISDGDLNIETKDKDDTVLPARFIATYDPANLEAPIWRIRLPKIA
jgi:hypothetical protein